MFFSPLSMDTLSEILIKIFHSDTTGTFNLGSKNGMSKYLWIRNS